MAKLQDITIEVLNPAFKTYLPQKMDSKPARLLLLTIGLQESRFEHRVQLGDGPAHGLWQFERGGGVAGVMRHSASNRHAENVCRARHVPFTRADIWKALVHDDILAAVFARLLLWTDPYPIPQPAWGSSGGWNLYQRTWRPGKPHPETWPAFWEQSREFVYGDA